MSQSSGRRELYIILGTVAALVALSTTLFVLSSRGELNLASLLGTKNLGELIAPPLPLSSVVEDPQWQDHSSNDYSDRLWTFLVIAEGGACGDACAQALYLTRQVRTALGRETYRVRRMLLLTAPPGSALTALIEAEHPDLVTAQLAPEQLRSLFSAQPNLDPYLAGQYFVVDPEGWLMLRYVPGEDGKHLLSDINFLLKNSPEKR
ncbi:MAG TPA: hypothetical protein VL027_01150 [Spongiibacteraceae bacterium]|jgi:hypothetical protein|nr:hypothetical protein [Spongiibacteraceae bacterium]HUH36527.1 hypothetical protein [Spongiibacteraceae bacterium]